MTPHEQRQRSNRDNIEMVRLIDQAFYLLESGTIQESIEMAHEQACTARGDDFPSGHVARLARRAHDAAQLRLLSAVAGLVGIRQAQADIEGRWEATDDLVSAVNLMLAAVEADV